MMNKSRYVRSAIMICVALLLLLAVPAALADGGIINPNQARIWELERQADSQRENLVSDSGAAVNDVIQPVTFIRITAPALGGVGTWRLSYNTQYCGTPISTNVRLSMKDYSSRYTTVWSMDYNGFPSEVSSCTIVSGGEYEFSVWVKSTTSGGGGYTSSVKFTIKEDSSHTSLSEKVASVAVSCKGSTQWETALNIHDWLTHNVYYDTTLHYYGADMILRGYGVCDGYAKAYLMMCKYAGISIYRVNNADHAWNVLKLDGAWYFVDSTWDDPDGATVAVSGSEHHDYFCLNTALLALDHPKPWDFTDTSAITCTALDDNYYIRRNDWNAIGNLKSGGTTYSASIANQIAANCGGNFISFDSFYYATENSGWNVTYPLDSIFVRGWTLLAYAMGKQPMYIPGYGNVNLDVWFSESDRCFIYAVRGFSSVQETGTLRLPARLTTINQEAFTNMRASTVIIPDGCRTIGRNAFSGSNVHKVYIPASVTSIDDTAFSGCSSLLILCVNNSAAMSYAQNNRILWHYP